METGKYIEKVKIFRHYTNYKGRLFVKALCDLFNDVAQTQTEQEGVDVETLNAAGATWMLRRLHIRLHKMPALNFEERFKILRAVKAANREELTVILRKVQS